MANLAATSTVTYSLRTLFAILTVVATLVAYVVNDRQWQKQHEAAVQELKQARTLLDSAELCWTPRHVRTRLVATGPSGRKSYMSMHSLSGDRSPEHGSGMMESDVFGSVYCRYLRTVDDRDLYEICIGAGIESMLYTESGETPGIVIKYVSYEGERIVVMDEGGYRVVMEPFEAPPMAPDDASSSVALP